MTRLAVVNRDKCSPVKCGKLCIKLCPVNRMGKECIMIAEDGKINIDEALCTGCGICPKRCPFGAIHIIKLPEQLTKQPIHRYGKNGFQLYSLPTPMFGKVVGIIGKNGIGKSTSIKILAGALKPNLGTRKKASVDDIVKYFKGTEAQTFFENVRDKKIKVAYKTQAVDSIPRSFSGTVKEFLKKNDEKKELENIAKDLEIEKILNNNIKNISGGELQRVAIAATVLKKANLYLFDEPSSYLDIQQRIKVSRFIRKLADEETAVLVVEHDLIILDFMTDLIHLMYGREACFGVVSQIKATRAGINTYLSGYLREENIRFRDAVIKFEKRPVIKVKKAHVLTSWSNINKKLNSFVLDAKQGNISQKQVIGVLGENSIGKTTFVKILAGILKPESGKIDKKVEISYKPQYLNTDSKELVSEFLKEAIKRYKNQIIMPLQLHTLLDRRLNELSGGELQRVMIAHCLSQEADLYLLDEPSAYLDIEQRLIVSKVIRDLIYVKEKSSLVVDHDLLFADYISDGLIVFSGDPGVHGIVNGPFDMESGMNKFLKGLNITLRRDPESHRPRINKPGSKMDRKQKEEGKLYYA